MGVTSIWSRIVEMITYRRPSISSATPMEAREPKVFPRAALFFRIKKPASVRIPTALSFDNIIAGNTCPPLTLTDFLHFLLHVTHSAENLQFFLWYRDYVHRFQELERIHPTESQLSRQWQDSQQSAAIKDYDWAKSNTNVLANYPYCNTPQPTTNSTKISLENIRPQVYTIETSLDTTSAFSCQQTAPEAFTSAGLHIPFSTQPFRIEIDKIIATYVADCSPRQLSLSSRDKYTLLKALSYTTHPSAFATVASSIEITLRQESHPGFIREATRNGNIARIRFAVGLGVFFILGAIVMGALVTTSSAPRSYRACVIVPLFLGVSTLLAALRGMCVVLHSFHRCHLKPWKIFINDTESQNEYLDPSSYSSNSYETQPWVAKYDSRNLIRKIFDRETWVKEPALRSIQDAMFLQSCMGAAIVSLIVSVILVKVPQGGFPKAT